MKKNKIIIVIISLAVLLTTGIVGLVVFRNTYSLNNRYDIVFHYAEDYKGILKTCKTGSDGKLNSNCVDFAIKICSLWSDIPYTGEGSQGSSSYTESDIKNATYTANRTFYCRAKSSKGKYPICYFCIADSDIHKWDFYQVNAADEPADKHYYIGSEGDSNCPGGYRATSSSVTEDECSYCYQCSANDKVFKWSTDSYGDSDCPGGYTQTNKSKAECNYVPAPACYVCTANSHIMSWKTDNSGDKNCSGGYTKTDKPQSECVTVEPACYECKTDSHIMFWKYDDKGDKNCSGGYKKTEKKQSECKSVTPACYQCKADNNVMKWKYDALGDNSCQGGYQKIDKPQSECKTIIPENPQTGANEIIFTWIAASIAIGCSLWYLRRSA